eukprot:gene13431-1645_t
MDPKELIDSIDAAMAKSTTWLKSNLPQTASSYNNGDESLALDCSTYMVLPWALRHIEEQYLKPDGSGTGSLKSAAAGSMTIYANMFAMLSYLCMMDETAESFQGVDGCHLCHAKIMRQVLVYQGRGKYGGFYGGSAEAGAGKGVFCFDSSGAGIVACAMTGMIEPARRGGEYLLRLAEHSNSERWYWALDSEGNAVDSHANSMWKHNSKMPCPVTNMCFMEKENPGIPHWKTGFFIACCVYLYRLLDDSRFLAAATRCADFALGTKDAGNWPMWGHKLAWGASELYAVTRDPKHLKMATELGLMLVHRQNEDGFFPYPEWFPPSSNPPPKPFPGSSEVYTTPSSSGLASAQRGPTAEPASVTYSICVQATIWMSKVKEALEISIAVDAPDVAAPGAGSGRSGAAGGNNSGGAGSASGAGDGAVPAAKRAKMGGGY